MSISNRHPLNLFTAGKSEAMSGQRLCRIGYKSTKQNPAKFPNVCASVPVLDSALILENTARMTDHIRAMLESAQDGIVRNLYENADGAMVSVSDDDISIDACISYLDALENGSRMTKEILAAWFDSALAENLFVAFAEKLGFSDITPDVEVTVGKHVAAHKAMIVALSGGKTSYNVKQCRGLLYDLSLTNENDDITGKLVKRLEKMIVESEAAVDALMLG